MKKTSQFRGLSATIMIFVVGSALAISGAGIRITDLGQPFDIVILSLLSVVSYEMLITFLFYIAENSDFFKKAYWGRKYLDGIWFYTSQDDQGGNNLGIYRISQDLFQTKLVAFRLGADFQKASMVNSVSDFLDVDNHHEVLCRRTDWDFSRGEYFSKAIIHPDEAVRKGLFRYPVVMRGEVIIYGGELNGLLSSNVVWNKIPDCPTEQSAIEYLRKRYRFDARRKRWVETARKN